METERKRKQQMMIENTRMPDSDSPKVVESLERNDVLLGRGTGPNGTLFLSPFPFSIVTYSVLAR